MQTCEFPDVSGGGLQFRAASCDLGEPGGVGGVQAVGPGHDPADNLTWLRGCRRGGSGVAPGGFARLQGVVMPHGTSGLRSRQDIVHCRGTGSPVIAGYSSPQDLDS